MKEKTLEIFTPDLSTKVELTLAAGTILAVFLHLPKIIPSKTLTRTG